MSELVTRFLLVAVGIVHLLPSTGALGPEHLERLYGPSPSSPDLEILLRHRAVLLGLLGGILIAAAHRPSLRLAAIVAGLASMVSYIALAGLVSDANAHIQRVAIVDGVAVILLIVSATLETRRRQSLS